MPSAYEGTDIISCLRSKYIMRREPYIISRKRYIIFCESSNSYAKLPKISFLTRWIPKGGTSAPASKVYALVVLGIER